MRDNLPRDRAWADELDYIRKARKADEAMQYVAAGVLLVTGTIAALIVAWVLA